MVLGAVNLWVMTSPRENLPTAKPARLRVNAN
jgi:hypothetical protein